MKRNLRLILTGIVLLSLLANCGQQKSKPEYDPTQGMTDGKHDVLSNRLTNVRGELRIGEKLEGKIGWPDWLHGYTINIEPYQVGQTISLGVAADRSGYLLVYGPSTKKSEDGQYLFDKPLFIGTTKPEDGYQWANFNWVPKQPGIYMAVYGPRYAWSATYTFRTECIENCEPKVEKLPIGSTCPSDEACVSGFCRCDDNDCTVRTCHETTPEGQQCGGFVPPMYRTKCDPGLICIGAKQPLDGPGRCSVPVNVADLMADPAAYEGRYVSVSGSLRAGIANCTQAMCMPGECCNSCGSEMILTDADVLSKGIFLQSNDGYSYVCGGSCNPTETCTATPGVYSVQGRFTAADGVPYVIVDSLSKIPY